MDNISTGIKGFDDIMGGLYPGDNVVWQVEDINNYKYVANAFAKKAIDDGKKVNYIKFGKMEPIIDDIDSINLFELDLDKRKLFKNGKEIELTPTEFSIVKYLMVNAKQSLSRDQILTEVWGNNYLYDFKIVDVNIRRIRNKIEDDPSKPKYIQTIWGYGYCFRKED